MGSSSAGRTRWKQSEPMLAGSTTTTTTNSHSWASSRTTSTASHSLTVSVDHQIRCRRQTATKNASSFSDIFEAGLDIATIRAIVASNYHNPLSTSG